VQALRSAFDRFSSSSSFEVVLREADTAADTSSSSSKQQAWGSVKYGKQAATPASSSGGGDAAAGAAVERLHTVLLRLPAVFTLAVVWESPKVTQTACTIRTTLCNAPAHGPVIVWFLGSFYAQLHHLLCSGHFVLISRCCETYMVYCVDVAYKVLSAAVRCCPLSLQAPLESIKGTVNALGPVVDLAQVYGGLSSAAPYNLRWVGWCWTWHVGLWLSCKCAHDA
jgi:hypothetical protein